MKCPKCGNPVMQNAKFCNVCGAAIQMESEQNSNKKKILASRKPLPVKKLISFGIIAAVAIIVIMLLFNVFKPSNYIIAETETFFTSRNGSEITIVHTSGNVATYEGEDFTKFYGSLDPGKGAVAITDDTDEGTMSTLYYVSEEGIKAFADADNWVSYGMVSADGNTVVFVTDSRAEESELKLFDSNKVQTISSEFYGSFCVSPDGKTVAYSAGYDGEVVAYIWNNGKSSVLGENLFPYAVSNGGKLIYFADADNGNMYVQRGDNKTRLASMDDLKLVYFNKDNTEILIGTNDKTYLCVNGKERFPLDDSLVSLLLPAGVNVAYFNGGSLLRGVNIESFKNIFYSTDSGVYRITEERDSERVARISDKVILANDGKTIFYLSFGAIYSLDGFDASAQAQKLVDDSVSFYGISNNGNTIYYLTNEGELYYKKGEAEPKLIDYDLDVSDYQFAVYDKSDTVFYINNGEMFSSKSGGKATIVSDVDDDGLYGVVSDYSRIYVYKTGVNPAYWSDDGKIFKSSDVN